MKPVKKLNKLQIIKQNTVKQGKLKEAQLVMAMKKEA
jgi:hypothetical protein